MIDIVRCQDRVSNALACKIRVNNEQVRLNLHPLEPIEFPPHSFIMY